jgi:predicted amidohydrolase
MITYSTQPLYYMKNGLIKFKKEKVNEPVKFLAFPEVSIPIEWLDDVARFVKKTGTAVICGVKHFNRKNRIYNCVATIIPVGNQHGKYENAFITLREKNDYSPDEISLIENNSFEYNKNENSYYNLFNWDGIKFSVFNCYELTDIYARAIMKSKLDILFAPVYNKDINYFSNIVESASRDIYCFVVQINNSYYGDTKINAPYNNELKCIVNIKGGEKDSVHIGKIDLKEYWDYQKFENTIEYHKWLAYNKKEEKRCSKKTYYKFVKYKKTSARYKRKF